MPPSWGLERTGEARGGHLRAARKPARSQRPLDVAATRARIRRASVDAFGLVPSPESPWSPCRRGGQRARPGRSQWGVGSCGSLLTDGGTVTPTNVLEGPLLARSRAADATACATCQIGNTPPPPMVHAEPHGPCWPGFARTQPQAPHLAFTLHLSSAPTHAREAPDRPPYRRAGGARSGDLAAAGPRPL